MPPNAIPVLVQAAPHLLAASPPWWGLTACTIIGGLILVLLTEWAKARFARPKTESDLQVAQAAIAAGKRHDENELLALLSKQYATVSEQQAKTNDQCATILNDYKTIIVQNAENAAIVKIQASEIEHLRSDVKELQAENVTLKVRLEAASAVSNELVVIKARVLVLENQIRDKDREIARLEAQIHVAQARKIGE